MRTIAPGLTKDGTVAADRLDFLIGKRCEVRVWWSREGQSAGTTVRRLWCGSRAAAA